MNNSITFNLFRFLIIFNIYVTKKIPFLYSIEEINNNPRKSKV